MSLIKSFWKSATAQREVAESTERGREGGSYRRHGGEGSLTRRIERGSDATSMKLLVRRAEKALRTVNKADESWPMKYG